MESPHNSQNQTRVCVLLITIFKLIIDQHNILGVVYAFGRCFYSKQFILHSKYTFYEFLGI